MTNLQVGKKLNGKKFYSETFGDTVTIKNLTVYCEDRRVEIINDKSTLRALVKESGLVL